MHGDFYSDATTVISTSLEHVIYGNNTTPSLTSSAIATTSAAAFLSNFSSTFITNATNTAVYNLSATFLNGFETEKNINLSAEEELYWRCSAPAPQFNCTVEEFLISHRGPKTQPLSTALSVSN